MTNKSNYWKFGGVLIIGVLSALLFSSVAFAQGEQPDEPPAGSAEILPDEIEGAPEAPEESQPEAGAGAGGISSPQLEENPLEDESALVEVEQEAFDEPESASDEPTLTEEVGALAQADLELADGSGAPLDLASQETAEAIAEADPYFTVGATTYRFFSGVGICNSLFPGELNITCFDNQGANVIQDVLTHIETTGHIPNDRKIYVESGTYGIANVTVNGVNPNMSAINGIIGVNTTGTNPIINGSVEITNLAGGFTLSGFTINGQVWVHDAAGVLVLEDLKVTNPTGAGISVSNFAGEVRMKDVNSSANRGVGAQVNNSAGKGKVSITNSKFEDNNNLAAGPTDGLSIISNGAVSLDGVSASRNEGTGMFMHDLRSSLTIKNAVMVNNDTTSGSGGYGLYVYAPDSKGAFLLDNVLVYGAAHNQGISLASAGSLQLVSVTSYNNLYNGVVIDNRNGTGSVKVSASDFYHNGHNGLLINSLGAVTLDSVRADDNTQNGVYIDNCNFDGAKCLGKGNVTVTSPKSGGSLSANHFNENGQDGLEIVSAKTVSIYNVVASDNMGIGVWIRHLYSVSPASVKVNLPSTEYETFLNEFVNNGQHGLYMQGGGVFTVDRFFAKDNGWNGMNIDNHDASGSRSISLSNGTIETSGGDGLVLESLGSVTLINVSSCSQTSGYGVSIGRIYGSVGGNVSIKTSGSGISNFNDNQNDGVYVHSLGSIYLKGISALGNHGMNANLNNLASSGKSGVTVLNSEFEGSVTDRGLYVNSKGNIIVSDVIAINNSGDGVSLYNNTGKGNVTITNGSFNENTIYGLRINSVGAVSLNAVQANGNNASGVNIDNCSWDGAQCLGNGGVGISAGGSARNEFNDNGSSGIYVRSGGNISLKNFSATGNSNYGVSLSNDYTGSSGNLSVGGYSKNPNLISGNGSSFYDYAMYLYSNGSVNISQTWVEDNSGYGAFINNGNPTAPKAVSISDSAFNLNANTGLYILSDSHITLSGVEASHNSVREGVISPSAGTIHDFLSWSEGLRPDKWWFTGGAPVTITLNSLDFDAYLELRNNNDSLLISDDNSGGGSNAAITAFGLPGVGDYVIYVMDANNTHGGSYTLNLSYYGGNAYYQSSGVYLENDGNITIKANKQGLGLRADDNAFSGLDVNTQGSISINKVYAEHNRRNNIRLDNAGAAEKSIKASDIYARESSKIYSDNYGISINTRGSVSIKNGFSIGNGSSGIYLTCYNSTDPRSVAISNFEISGNRGWTALYVSTKGDISLNSVSVNRNASTSYGAYLDNCVDVGAGCTGSGHMMVGGKNNEFDDNAGLGIIINTTGNVTLANFSASRNSDTGVTIYNSVLSEGKITINNTLKGQFNHIDGNAGPGLSIGFHGNVNINRLRAMGNLNTNLVVDNNSGSSAHWVILANSILSSSQTSLGATIVSNGAITLNNVFAHENFLTGISLSNASASDPQMVKVSRTQANGNGSYGIFAASKGDMEFDTLQAANNVADGLSVNNSFGVGSLTIKGSYGDNVFINNDNGIVVSAGGSVSLDRIQSISNAYDGIAITHIPGKSGAVTGKRLTALRNANDGLDFALRGALTLESVISMGNGSSGDFDGLHLVIQNEPAKIKNSVFIGNTGNGIETFLSSDMLTLTNVNYFGNDTNHTLEPDLLEH